MLTTCVLSAAVNGGTIGCSPVTAHAPRIHQPFRPWQTQTAHFHHSTAGPFHSQPLVVLTVWSEQQQCSQRSCLRCQPQNHLCGDAPESHAPVYIQQAGFSTDTRQCMKGIGTDTRQRMKGSRTDRRQRMKGISTDRRQRVKGISTDRRQRVKGISTDRKQRVKGISTDRRQRMEGISSDRRQRVKGISTNRRQRMKGISTDRRRHIEGISMGNRQRQKGLGSARKRRKCINRSAALACLNQTRLHHTCLTSQHEGQTKVEGRFNTTVRRLRHKSKDFSTRK